MAFKSPYCPVSYERQLAYQKTHGNHSYCDICFFRKIGCEIPSSKNFVVADAKYYFVVQDQIPCPTAKIDCQKCGRESAVVIHRVVLEKQEIGYLLECSCGHRFVTNIYSYEYRLSKILKRSLTKRQREKRKYDFTDTLSIVASFSGSEEMPTAMQMAFEKAGIS